MSARHLVFALLALFGAAPAAAELSIEAPGAPAEVVDNVRAHLRLAKEPCDAPPWRIRREFRRLERDIQPALRAFGYYDAQVETALTSEEPCWHVQLTLALGEPVLVRELQLELSGEALGDPEFEALRAALPLTVGSQLHHGKYEEIKTRLRNLALERGYFDAKLTRHELLVDPGKRAATIRIGFDSGQRYRFGAVQLSEQPLDEDFVRRLGGLQPGSLYEGRALVELDRNLSDAGYFKRVEVRPQRDRIEDQAVPIDVTLEPLPRHAWRAGIGYATDTGPRLSLGYANRLINRKGHQFDSELRLSPVESGITADYLIPSSDPKRRFFNINAALIHEVTDSTTSDRVSLAGLQTLVHDDWTEVRFIELLHERSEIGSDTTESTLLMPGFAFKRTQADDLLRTRRGYRVNLEARGAYEGLLSSTSLLQFMGSAKGVYRFGDAGRVTGRTNLGVTLGGEFFDLPASLRFFAGGDNSVRGYAYKSLSPLDENGDAIGGRHLITASLEYEHPVAGEDWWGGAFVDAGNAFDTDDFDLKYGYGVGVRWYSPVGRVRLDLAFPSDSSDDSWRLHFSVGADL
ncbi:MAG: hypothetical protein RLZ44_1138 [Pseudomonadota bacterium]